MLVSRTGNGDASAFGRVLQRVVCEIGHHLKTRSSPADSRRLSKTESDTLQRIGIGLVISLIWSFACSM